jgi:tape measure domain-containing protein
MTAQVAGQIVYNLDVNTTKFVAGMRTADSGLANLGQNMDKADSSAQKLGGGLNKVTVALGGLASIKALQTMQAMSEEFTVLRARIDRFSGGVEQGAENYQRLLNISSKTGSDMATAVKTWESLTGALQEMGKSNDDIVGLTDTLLKMGIVGGSSAEEMKNGLRQLGQSFSGGIIRGEEFNSVLENTPEIARQLAKGLGVPFSELRKMMLDSQLTTEVVFDALKKRTEAIDADFAKMPRTVAQATNAIKNEFGSALSKLDQESGFSVSLAKGIDLVASKIAGFAGDAAAMSDALDMIAGAASSVAAVIAGRVLTSLGSYIYAQGTAIKATMAAIEAGKAQAVGEVNRAQAIHAGNLADLERAKTAVSAAAAGVSASRQVQAAEIARMETAIASIQAEKALEAVRLSAQITDKGRAASIARMAELQRAQLVLTGQLTAAQATLAATTVSTSTAMTVATEGRAVASEAAAASALRLGAATSAMAAITSGATVVMNGLKTAMAFLGGPIGVAMLAALAIYQFGIKSEEAAPKADLLTQSIDEMGNAMLKLNRIKVAERIDEMNKSLDAESIKAYNAQAESLRKNLEQFPGSPNVAKWTKDLAEAEGKSEEAEKGLKALQDRLKAIDDETKKRAGEKPAEKVHKTSSEDQRVIDNLKDQRALAALAGEARARLAAEQKLSATATAEEKKAVGDLAVEIYKLEQVKKDGKEAEKDANKQAAKDAKELEKAAKEAVKTAEENSKAITDYAVSIGMAAMKGEDLVRAQAAAKLNKFATPEDVATMDALARAMYKVQQAEESRKLLGSVDPIEGENQAHAKELADLELLNQQKQLSNDRYLELKSLAEDAHSQKLAAIREQEFRDMSASNELMMASLDALGSSGAQAISGILSGTGDLKSALAGIANTVFNTVIGSFTQMGVEWVKQEIIKRAATKATEAAQVASTAAVTTAQVAATGTIASTTVGAAAATGPAVATAMAPAAGLSSIASFGGAAVIGGAALLGTMALAKSFGGGRRYGGGVSADSMYQVNEGGAPEIFNSSDGKQYMMPNTRGEVVSNADATKGGGSGQARPIEIRITNNGSQEVTATQTNLTEKDVIDIVVGNMANGGEIARTTNAITGTNRQGT